MRSEGVQADPVYGSVMDLRLPGRLDEMIRGVWFDAGIRSVRILKTEILQIHYKPYERARILAAADLEEVAKPSARGRQYFFLQIYARAEQAGRAFEKGALKTPRKCYGPPLFMPEGRSSVAWALPNGPRLGPIRIFFDAGKFSRFLLHHTGIPPSASTSEAALPQLLRYVPRKRALFRFTPPQGDGTHLYFKVFAPGSDEKAANHLTCLTQAFDRGMLNFRVPRIVAYSPAHRTVVMNGLPGERLTTLMEERALSHLFARVGTALAGLHRSGIQAPNRWTPQREMSKLHKAMSDVRMALPDLANALNPLLDQISDRERNLVFDDRTVIHGNLFGDQILIDEDGVGIVDWDDLAQGDPLYDLGRLIAHLIFLAKRSPAGGEGDRILESLIDGYAGGSPSRIDFHRLSWHIAVALLMRAKISALRSLHRGWVEDISLAIHESTRVMEGRSRWILQ